MRNIDNTSRRSLSNISKAIILVVVILVASIAAFYLFPRQPSESSTTQNSTTPLQNFLVLELDPQNVLIAPGSNESYASLNIIPISTIENVTLSLTATADPGLAISISQSSVPYDPSVTSSIPITLVASADLTPGNYPITIDAQAGSSSYSQNFSVEVVKTLVIIQHESFIPPNITVSAGSTVVWMNIDTEIGCCDPGFHTVTFVPSSGNVSSPVLHRFDVWSYQFPIGGDYKYYCTIHPNMHGSVVVT